MNEAYWALLFRISVNLSVGYLIEVNWVRASVD